MGRVSPLLHLELIFLGHLSIHIVLIFKLLFDQDKLLFKVARFYSAMQTCLILRLVITSYFRIIQIFSSISGHADHYVIIILTNNRNASLRTNSVSSPGMWLRPQSGHNSDIPLRTGNIWLASVLARRPCLPHPATMYFSATRGHNCTKNVTTDELMTIETILPHTSLFNKYFRWSQS